MATSDLQTTIEAAFEDRESISPETTGPARRRSSRPWRGLDAGTLRVAEKQGGDWIVNQWLKMAVLLSFRLYDMTTIGGGPVKIRPGSTKYRRSSRTGTTPDFVPLDFVPCRVAWSAARRTSPLA